MLNAEITSRAALSTTLICVAAVSRAWYGERLLVKRAPDELAEALTVIVNRHALEALRRLDRASSARSLRGLAILVDM